MAQYPESGMFVKIGQYKGCQISNIWLLEKTKVGAVECLMFGSLPDKEATKLALSLGLPVVRERSPMELDKTNGHSNADAGYSDQKETAL